MSSILIVEDEPKMRRLLEISLGEDGHVVHTAPQAETGLQCLRREAIDLVLTDLQLRGMNGLEFIQEAKRLDAGMPIVVMTAYRAVDTAVCAMKSEATAYVLMGVSK